MKKSPFLRSINVIFLIFNMLIMVGCATNFPAYKKDNIKTSRVGFIDNVPFIKQEPDYCGPATLAMLFNFWGMNITQEEIAQDIYSAQLKGTLSIEMVLYAKQKDFEAEMYNGDLQDIKDKISAGFPLIVSHRTKKKHERVHYLIVRGFDDNKEIIYAHSGPKENVTMNYDTFLKRWGLADNLVFLIYPPGEEIKGLNKF